MMRYLDEYRVAPDQIEDFLDRPSLALLAVADGSGPEVGMFPFLYREGRVEMHLERSDLQLGAIERAGCGTVVVSELLSMIPSYWVDPDNVLFADAFHRTVVVRGPAVVVREPTVLWDHLRSLLSKYQGEGANLDFELQHYRRAAARLNVVCVSAHEILVKFKLGQQLSEVARRRIIAGLQDRDTELDRHTAGLVAATLEH